MEFLYISALNNLLTFHNTTEIIRSCRYLTSLHTLNINTSMSCFLISIFVNILSYVNIFNINVNTSLNI